MWTTSGKLIRFGFAIKADNFIFFFGTNFNFMCSVRCSDFICLWLKNLFCSNCTNLFLISSLIPLHSLRPFPHRTIPNLYRFFVVAGNSIRCESTQFEQKKHNEDDYRRLELFALAQSHSVFMGRNETLVDTNRCTRGHHHLFRGRDHRWATSIRTCKIESGERQR